MKSKTQFEQAGFKATDSFVLKEGVKHFFIRSGEVFTLLKDGVFSHSNVQVTNERIAAYDCEGVPINIEKIKVVERKTPFEQAGFKKTDRFKVVKCNDRLNTETIVKLDQEDNGANELWFKPEGKSYRVVLHLDWIEKLKASDDGWIEWNGGECPVEKGTRIDVKYRDGKKCLQIPAGVYDVDESYQRLAEDWSHDGSPGDIVEYRLPKPQALEQAGVWIEWNGKGRIPVKANTLIEVAYRNGLTSGPLHAYQFDWVQTDQPDDIITYRVCKVRSGVPDTDAAAHTILTEAKAQMTDRAKERDTEDGERSMAKTVNAFNAMFGKDLTETQGWQFMELLKMARSTGGAYRRDDFVDGAAYVALAGESASKGETE